MKSLFSLVIGATLAIGSLAHADETATRVPVTRGGKTVVRVAYQFWSGEYPGPIIDVGGSNKGVTTISGFKSLRKLDQPVKCTIKNGLYHPWSNEKVSPHSFYTLTAQDNYKVIADTEIESYDAESKKIPLAKGSTIENVVYYGENMCGATWLSAADSANVKLELQFGCEFLDSKEVQKTSPADNFSEEWIHVTCADGSKAFVGANSLLKQKGVIEGDLEGYGSVKRASKKK